MESRKVKQYVLLHPDDCDPPHGLDLEPGSRDSLKVEYLVECFTKDGFSKKHAALVGYPLNGRIQLASGTHRHEAAKRANIFLPVTLMLRSYVEAKWGTENWAEFIKDIPVEDLELVDVVSDIPPGLDERIDLSRDLEY